jgi:hypothetical protein
VVKKAVAVDRDLSFNGGGTRLQFQGTKVQLTHSARAGCPDCGQLDCDCLDDLLEDLPPATRELVLAKISDAAVAGIEALLVALAEHRFGIDGPQFVKAVRIATDSVR